MAGKLKMSILSKFLFAMNCSRIKQHPMRSRLRGVWKDPNIGSLTLIIITTHKEADSKCSKIKQYILLNYVLYFFG